MPCLPDPWVANKRWQDEQATRGFGPGFGSAIGSVLAAAYLGARHVSGGTRHSALEPHARPSACLPVLRPTNIRSRRGGDRSSAECRVPSHVHDRHNPTVDQRQLTRGSVRV